MKETQMTVALTPPASPDNVQADEPEENAENRQYVKNSVTELKKSGEWILKEVNERSAVCGTAITACGKIMEMTGSVMNAVLPANVLEWVPTSMEDIDDYVEKADHHIDQVVTKTDMGKWTEEVIITTASSLKQKADAARDACVQGVEAVSNTKNAVITQATKGVNMIVQSDNAEFLMDATTYTVKQTVELAQNQLARVSEGINSVKELPATTLAHVYEYADYDGDGKITMSDIGNSVKQTYTNVQNDVHDRLNKGIDYLMPQVGEEAPAEDSDGFVDNSEEEATRVSLSSKFINRLQEKISVILKETPYVGEKGLQLAMEASKYIEYLQAIELKDLPVPEVVKEKLTNSIELAATQAGHVKDALLKLLQKASDAASDVIDLDSYKGEIYKPMENITPYFSRMAQERNIASVPADVLNVAACMFGIRRGTPEVMHLTESIEKLLHAVFDVTVMFSKSGAGKDG